MHTELKLGKFVPVFLMLLFLAMGSELRAQIVIDNELKDFMNDFDPESFEPVAMDTSYWSFPKRIGVHFTLNTFKDWNAGGNNSFSTKLNGLFQANYLREYIVWNNKLDVRYGMIWESPKELPDDARNINVTDNYLEVTSTFGYKAIQKMYFSSEFKFQTQMAKMFTSKTSDTYKSAFMAPAYFDLGAGMEYKDNFKRFGRLNLYMAFFNMKTTVVLDEELARAGAFGVQKEVVEDGIVVTPYERYRMEFGFKVRADHTVTLWKNLQMINKFDMFVDYIEDPGAMKMDWEMVFNMKINNYLTTQFINNMRYYDSERKKGVDEDGNSILLDAVVQLKQALSVGFVFTF